ncbi:VOC family protein [Deinococcus sp.]|uniref:VOC family protein n=1 Tax=Deinococcus sp. TaxID=47478 RepID=UPI002869EAB3|nr:VOC family protein [Deinococcus sp.]
MHIDHLTLRGRDLRAQRDFYAGTLGLPVVAETPERLTVQAGSSSLTFGHDPAHTAFSHLAFDIPRALVDGAQAWLEARVPLLADHDGRNRFGPNEQWNTTNLYFADPAGNILEFIARHDLPHDHAGPFGPGHILHVSEFGLVVDDVPGAVRWLGDTHDLRPFNGRSDTFTAVGGHGGMLIVVPAGRGWMPTGQPAVPAPFALAWSGIHSLTSATVPTLAGWRP